MRSGSDERLLQDHRGPKRIRVRAKIATRAVLQEHAVEESLTLISASVADAHFRAAARTATDPLEKTRDARWHPKKEDIVDRADVDSEFQRQGCEAESGRSLEKQPLAALAF